MIEVKESPGKGRGVFAVTPFSPGDCIERSPVIVIPEEEIIHIRRTVFGDYFFKWRENGKDGALALGYGSLFNHSYEPNAVFTIHVEAKTVDFHAIQPIVPGEEITVNYNGRPDDRSKLWFHPVE